MASSYALFVLLVTGAMTSASASLPTTCITIPLSNILNIGNCLGGATNFCGSTSTTGVTQGITKITSCVIQGIFQTGSNQGILSALSPLLALIANTLSSGFNLGTLANNPLCGASGCLGFLVKNDTCAGSINIGLPFIGNLASCAGNAALVCTTGLPTTTNLVQSLVQTVVCILQQLSTNQLFTVLRGIICQLIMVITQALQGNFALLATFSTFSTAITAALGVFFCPITG